ncbi:MAG: hypothetical protein Q9207_008510 [Kuettlingeria erythrocarpa]
MGSSNSTQNVREAKENTKPPGNKQTNPTNQPSKKDKELAQNKAASGSDAAAETDPYDEFFKRNLFDIR